MISKVSAFAALAAVGLAVDPTADRIDNLPGLTWSINFKQYSGYLNLTNGHNLHYWFVESQNNPSTDPVVLWCMFPCVLWFALPKIVLLCCVCV